MPKYTILIGDEERTIDKEKFDSNYDAILQKYPDARIRAFNGEEKQGLLPIVNYSKAIERGYRIFESDVTPEQANNSTSTKQTITPEEEAARLAALDQAEEQARGVISRSDAELKTEYNDRQRAEDERLKKEPWYVRAFAGMGKSYQNRGPNVNPTDSDKKIQALHAASKRADDSLDVINEARKKGDTSFLTGAGRGLMDAVSDVATWDMGVTNLSHNSRLGEVIQKHKDGLLLTSSEELLLESASLEQAIYENFSEDLGRGYKAGSVTGESIPFMIEMAMNPASGIGNASSKAALKSMVKKYGREGAVSMAKKASGKAALAGAQVAGDIAGASIMSATSGSVRILADAQDRHNGQIDYGVDENGYVRFNDVVGQEEYNTALLKAFGANTIENYSEMVGEAFSTVGRFFTGAMAKGARKTKLGNSVMNVIDNVRASDWAKAISRYEKKVQWHGVVGEWMEENVGMVLNAAIVGDDEFSDLTDLNQQIDTFLGVGLMGGFFSVVKTFGYNNKGLKAKRAKEAADQRGTELFGEEWKGLRDGFDLADMEGRQKILSSVLANDSYGKDKKEVFADYAQKCMEYIGTNLANAKRYTEGDVHPLYIQFENAFETGEHITEPTDRNELYEAVDRAREGVLSVIGDNSSDIIESIEKEENPADVLSRIMVQVPEEVASALIQYYNAKASYDGMINRVRDDIDSKVEKARKAIQERTHVDGNVYDVTLKVDDSHVHLIGDKRVVFDADGYVDRINSDERVLVRDESGKISMRDVSELDKLYSYENAEVLISATIEPMIAQEQQRIADEIEGVREFQQEEIVTIKAESGVKQVVVGGLTPDGLYEVHGVDNVPLREGEDISLFSARELSFMERDAIKEIERENMVPETESVESEYTNESSEELQERLSHLDNAIKSGALTEEQKGEVFDAVSSIEEELNKRNSIKITEKEGENESSPISEENKLSEIESIRENAPKQKNGEIDYDALLENTPEYFAKLFSSEEGIEETVRELQSVSDNVAKKIKTVQSRLDNSDSINKRKAAKTELTKLQERKERIDSIIESYVEDAVESPVVENENNQSVIPVAENGEVLYHKVPVDTALSELFAMGLSNEEIDSFAQLNVSDAEKAVRRIEKDIPKMGINLNEYLLKKNQWEESLSESQAKLEYWKGLSSELKRLEEKPGDKVVQDVSKMEEALTGEELAASMLASGKIRLLRDSYLKETGFGEGDARNMFGLFASKENGGLSIEEAGEQLMLADLENGTNFFDLNNPNAGRNTIIEVLSSARTRGDLNNYINNNRESVSKREQEAEYAAYEKWVNENTGMSVEEFEAYEESFAQRATEKYSGITDEILNSIFAELNNESYEGNRRNDSGRVLDVQQGGPELLSGERAVYQGTSEESRGEPGRTGENVEPGDGSVQPLSEEPGKSGIDGPVSIFDEAERVVSLQAIKKEESQVNTEPSEAQKEAGNYKMGHIKLGGYDVSIENPQGSIRSGVDENGREWSQTINNTYGYFRRTEGKDGDHVDVFIGDNPKSEKVFVVDQVHPNNGKFDEHKVMYGFNSTEDARSAYLSNYEPNWKGLGQITEVSKERFDGWMKEPGKKEIPFADYLSQELHYNELADMVNELNSLTGRDVGIFRNRNEIVKRLESDNVEQRVIDEINATFEQAEKEGTVFPAFFDSKTGKIYLCANQIKDSGTLIKKYFHEAMHLASAKNLTDQQLEYLYNIVGEEVIREYVPLYYFEQNISDSGLAGEYLSYLTENLLDDTETRNLLLEGKVDDAVSLWELAPDVVEVLTINLNSIYGLDESSGISANMERENGVYGRDSGKDEGRGSEAQERDSSDTENINNSGTGEVSTVGNLQEVEGVESNETRNGEVKQPSPRHIPAEKIDILSHASENVLEQRTEIPVMTEEEYLSANGAFFMGGAEPALHKNIKDDRNKQKNIERVSEEMRKNNERREELRKEYKDKLSKGELREPTRIEKLIKTANGHPDLEGTQAARRLLEKRGIDYKDYSDREKSQSEELSEPSLVVSNTTQLQIDWDSPTNYIRQMESGPDVESAREKANYESNSNEESVTYSERQLVEQGHLTFMGNKLTGSAKIKSSADVAFLFKNLESAATENAFAVLMREDGSYSVLYLGTGGTNSAVIDVKQVVTAANELEASKVVLVHNHPSGNLNPSRQDYNIHSNLGRILKLSKIELGESVIINLDSGKYTTFDDFEHEKRNKKKNKPGSIEAKVYQFDRQVLYVPSTEKHSIKHSDDVAKFLSIQKRGAVPKIQMLVLGTNNSINRYVVLDPNMNVNELTSKIIYEVGKHGENVILASNGIVTPAVSKAIAGDLRSTGINLIDVLTVKQDIDIIGNYTSFANEGFLEPISEYNFNNRVEDSGNKTKNPPTINAGESILDYAKRVSDWWKTQSGQINTMRKKINESKAEMSRLRHERNKLKSSLKGIKRTSEKKTERVGQIKEVAGKIEKYIRDNMSKEIAEWMGAGEFSQLISKLHNPTSQKDVDAAMRAIDKTINNIELRKNNKILNTLLNTKILDKNKKGVSVAKNVDDETRKSMMYIKENRKLSEAEIEERIKEIEHRQDEGKADEADSRTVGNLELVRLLANINVARNNISEIDGEIRNTEGTTIGLEKERIDAQKALIDAYNVAIKEFSDFIETGKSKLALFKEQELERKRTIGYEAIEAVRDRPILSQADEKNKGWKENMRLWINDSRTRKLLMAPQGSFNFMIKYIDKNHPMGEGKLYKRFMKSEDSVYAANDNYYTRLRSFREEVMQKAEEIFGLKFNSILKDSRNDSRATLSYLDKNGEAINIKMTNGELMYIYMVSKMNDGNAKLEKMGISEERVEQIKEELGDKYIAFADWIQEEFLPSKRKVYNKTHKKIFGVSMAEIENYFPLIYDSKEHREEVNLGEISYGMPSTMTGNIINRVRNNKPLSLSSNAFDVLMEHGQKMEEWDAYAMVRKDLNGLLSNLYVKNLIEANDKTAHKRLREASGIAVRSYVDSTQEQEKLLADLNRYMAGGAIAFRLNTALKQTLSLPAFLSYSSNPKYLMGLARNLSPDVYASNIKWAMDNLPGFRERWESGNVGNEKLVNEHWSTEEKSTLQKFLDGYVGIGMIPNKAVDAFTVVAGSKSIYDYAVEKYKKSGMSKEESERIAKFDAGIAYNESQQSSRPEFLAPVQKSGTLFNRAMTTFMNANYSYMRKESEAVYQLMRSSEKQRNQLTKEYVADGMNVKEAQRKAESVVSKTNAKAVKDIALFGVFMQTSWMLAEKILYGLWDDDDEKEKDIIKALAVSPVYGLYGGSSLEAISGGHNPSFNPILFATEWNKLYNNIKKAAEEDGLISNGAAIEATKAMLKSGGINFDTWLNYYKAIELNVRNGEWDSNNTFYFLNAPASVRKSYASKIREDESVLDYAQRVADSYTGEIKKAEMKKTMRKKIFAKDGDMTEFNRMYEKAKRWETLKKEEKAIKEKSEEYKEFREISRKLEPFKKNVDKVVDSAMKSPETYDRYIQKDRDRVFRIMEDLR